MLQLQVQKSEKNTIFSKNPKYSFLVKILPQLSQLRMSVIVLHIPNYPTAGLQNYLEGISFGAKQTENF